MSRQEDEKTNNKIMNEQERQLSQTPPVQSIWRREVLVFHEKMPLASYV